MKINMKTIITKTDAFKYAIFAIVIAAIAFFAVLPFISDVNEHTSGPSLMALFVKADDGSGSSGGDTSGGDSGSGTSGGSSTGGDDGSGTSGGTSGSGCCTDGGSTGGSTTGGSTTGGTGESPSGTSPVSGMCGTAKNTCASGDLGSNTEQPDGSFHWICDGRDGGSGSALCVYVPPTAGSCDLRNPNECLSGTLGVNNIQPDGSYHWYCNSANGGASSNLCTYTPAVTAPTPTAGVCGTTANSCASGNLGVNNRQSDGSYHWYCNGTNNGATSNLCTYTPATVTATPAPVNGVCSTVIDSCVSGSPTTAVIQPNGDHHWYCDGSNGGTRSALCYYVPLRCEITFSKPSVASGEPVTLTWTTNRYDNNVSTFTVGGLGNLSVLGGSMTINPTVSKTYYGTLFDNLDFSPRLQDDCSATINVTNAPACIPVWQGNNIWYQGQGMNSCPTGTHMVSTTGPNDNQFCGLQYNTCAPNTVTPVVPVCTLQANTEQVTAGGAVVLSWTSNNVSGGSLSQNNQSIGSVTIPNGTKTVNPTQTTTYTFTGQSSSGQTVTCSDTVTVITTQNPAPICELNASQGSIVKGGSSTLTWDTTYASTVTLDNGSVVVDGSRVVSPTQNTTYTLTAIGNGQTVTCIKTIVVEEPEPALNCDAFSASPSTLTAAGQTTLNWMTTGADTIVINNGIGPVTEDGSRLVNVTADTNFILTLTKGTQTKTCEAPVTIRPNAIVPKCDAFTVSDSSVRRGDNVTLNWQTTNADTVVINNGVGTVAQDGNASVRIDNDTTYTLTATKNGASDTCQVTVNTESDGGGGGGGGGSSAPRCVFTASDKKISAGDKVTLSWKNTRTNDIRIKDNRGNEIVDTRDNDDDDINPDKDSVTVRPTRSTSYTLTAYRGSRTRDCTVDINVDGVSVSSTRSQTPLVAGISLSSVPYTGFDAGPFLTTVFYTLLALWGLGIAYVLVLKDGTVFGFSMRRQELAHAGPALGTIVTDEPAEYAAYGVATVPSNLPVASIGAAQGYAAQGVDEDEAKEVGEDDTFSFLENRAHAARVLLSSDAIRFISGQKTDIAEQAEILDRVVELAKATYPSENGWVVVNKEKLMSLLK